MYQKVPKNAVLCDKILDKIFMMHLFKNWGHFRKGSSQSLNYNKIRSAMARDTTKLQYEQKMSNLLSKYRGVPQLISMTGH